MTNLMKNLTPSIKTTIFSKESLLSRDVIAGGVPSRDLKFQGTQGGQEGCAGGRKNKDENLLKYIFNTDLQNETFF